MADIDPDVLRQESEEGLWCICEDCEKKFRLTADDWSPLHVPNAYLSIRGCDSGGIYSIEVECPHCNHCHELR
jgi:hypothetical protein